MSRFKTQTCCIGWFETCHSAVNLLLLRLALWELMRLRAGGLVVIAWSANRWFAEYVGLAFHTILIDVLDRQCSAKGFTHILHHVARSLHYATHQRASELLQILWHLGVAEQGQHVRLSLLRISSPVKHGPPSFAINVS